MEINKGYSQWNLSRHLLTFSAEDNQGSYSNWYTDQDARQKLLTSRIIDRISIGRMALMFSFYLNFDINVFHLKNLLANQSA